MSFDSPSPSSSHARRLRVALRTVAALIAAAAASFGLLAWIAPSAGMYSIGPLILLLVGTWASFAVILGLALPPATGCCLRIGAYLSIGIATFFVVAALFSFEIDVLVAWRLSNPPPRPMFHNLLRENERVLLPIWYDDLPIIDERRNLTWADHEDNVLVSVLGGAKRGTRMGPEFGDRESRFPVGDFASERWVVVRRTKNSFVVIRQDGGVAHFPLPADFARGFHFARQSKSFNDAIADVRISLDAENRARLDSFVAGM